MTTTSFYHTERAAFASCPQEYSGCSKEVPLSVASGNPAIFDASITYTPGGSCNFKQEITRVKLTKINGQSNLPNTLLFTCHTDHGAPCLINDNRLSLSRGDGLDYNVSYLLFQMLVKKMLAFTRLLWRELTQQ